MSLAPLLLTILLLTGCSNFDHEWQAAGDKPRTGIDGRWTGLWKSQQNGHTGELLCALRQTAPGQYLASFRATYGGFLNFTYDATLTGRPQDPLIHLSGSQDLGWPVGVYTYDGAASPTQFYCTYQSKDDHGYFTLAAPGQAPPAGPLENGAATQPTH